MFTSADVSELPELYAADALYLEPYNPPHRGNLLIQAYLKDWLAGKDEIEVEAKRVIESEDGTRWRSSGRSPTPQQGGGGATCHAPASSGSARTGASSTTATTPDPLAARGRDGQGRTRTCVAATRR
jgi:hypothetical protein